MMVRLRGRAIPIVAREPSAIRKDRFAAAEMAAVARGDWLAALEDSRAALRTAFNRKLTDAAQTLDWLARRLPSLLESAGFEDVRVRALTPL